MAKALPPLVCQGFRCRTTPSGAVPKGCCQKTGMNNNQWQLGPSVFCPDLIALDSNMFLCFTELDFSQWNTFKKCKTRLLVLLADSIPPDKINQAQKSIWIQNSLLCISYVLYPCLVLSTRMLSTQTNQTWWPLPIGYSTWPWVSGKNYTQVFWKHPPPPPPPPHLLLLGFKHWRGLFFFLAGKKTFSEILMTQSLTLIGSFKRYKKSLHSSWDQNFLRKPKLFSKCDACSCPSARSWLWTLVWSYNRRGWEDLSDPAWL